MSFVGLALAPRRAQGAPQAATLQSSPFDFMNVSNPLKTLKNIAEGYCIP
jgi:hypothetical protein